MKKVRFIFVFSLICYGIGLVAGSVWLLFQMGMSNARELAVPIMQLLGQGLLAIFIIESLLKPKKGRRIILSVLIAAASVAGTIGNWEELLLRLSEWILAVGLFLGVAILIFNLSVIGFHRKPLFFKNKKKALNLVKK